MHLLQKTADDKAGKERMHLDPETDDVEACRLADSAKADFPDQLELR